MVLAPLFGKRNQNDTALDAKLAIVFQVQKHFKLDDYNQHKRPFKRSLCIEIGRVFAHTPHSISAKIHQLRRIKDGEVALLTEALSVDVSERYK